MPLELFPELNDQPPESACDLRSEGKILTGDARIELNKLEASTVQCCITSPPYWGLRDYGIDGQIGAEMELPDYISQLVEEFEEFFATTAPSGGTLVTAILVGDALGVNRTRKIPREEWNTGYQLHKA